MFGRRVCQGDSQDDTGLSGYRGNGIHCGVNSFRFSCGKYCGEQEIMNFVEGKTVGIDLGTSYSAIARLDEEGAATILENGQGRLITPSIVILVGRW